MNWVAKTWNILNLEMNVASEIDFLVKMLSKFVDNQKYSRNCEPNYVYHSNVATIGETEKKFKYSTGIISNECFITHQMWQSFEKQKTDFLFTEWKWSFGEKWDHMTHAASRKHVLAFIVYVFKSTKYFFGRPNSVNP